MAYRTGEVEKKTETTTGKTFLRGSSKGKENGEDVAIMTDMKAPEKTYTALSFE